MVRVFAFLERKPRHSSFGVVICYVREKLISLEFNHQVQCLIERIRQQVKDEGRPSIITLDALARLLASGRRHVAFNAGAVEVTLVSDGFGSVVITTDQSQESLEMRAVADGSREYNFPPGDHSRLDTYIGSVTWKEVV